MKTILEALLRVAALGTAAPLVAQPASNRIEQIGSGEHEPVQQISTGSRQIPTSVRSEQPSAGLSEAQLSGRRDNAAPPQLTSERASARASTQLYTGGRTAQASEPLSRPIEGRTGVVTPVTGEDRCDPARQSDPAIERICATVIEKRAAEFARPDTTQLSPEQQILIEQRGREGSSLKDASRRLAENEIDPDSVEAQSVASAALSDRTATPSPAEQPSMQPAENLSDAAKAIVDAIVAGVTGQVPPPR